jgi:hypothetical protein
VDAAMTFPTIPTAAAGRILATLNTAGGATKTFPDLTSLTKNAGDLLIAIAITYDGNSTNAEFSSWGGGFTEFVDQATTATMAIGAAYKWSTGSETGTFTVTTADTSTSDSVLILLSIPGAHPTTPPEGGVIANGTTAAADPPASLDPAGWGAEDTLWIAVGGSGETSGTGSYTGLGTAPANYTDLFETGITADVVGGVEGGIAFRQLNAASENVGAFGVDVSNARNSALLIAVRPAAELFTRAPADDLGLTDGGVAVNRFGSLTDTADLTDSVDVDLSAGIDYTRSPVDDLGLTDGGVAVNRSGSLTDNLGFTDTVDAQLSAGGDHTRAPADNLGLTDDRLVELTRAVADTLGITDSPISIDSDEAVTDPLGLTDSVGVEASGAISRTLADTLGLSDAQAIDRGLGLAENLGLTDTAAAVVDHTRSPADPLGLTDTVNVEAGGAATRQVDDTLGLTDARALDRTATVTDTLGLTDTTARIVDTARQPSDTLGLSDTVDVQAAGATTRQVADNLGLVDTAAVAASHARAVTDTLGLTDAVQPVGGFARAVTDTLGLTDSVAVETGEAATRAASDTLGLTDARLVEVGPARADNLGLTDAISITMATIRTVDDLLGLIDTADRATITVRTVDDLLGLTDEVIPPVSRGIVSGRVRAVGGVTGQHRQVATVTAGGG